MLQINVHQLEVYITLIPAESLAQHRIYDIYFSIKSFVATVSFSTPYSQPLQLRCQAVAILN